MSTTQAADKPAVEPVQLASPSGPITESSRLTSIDVARGIALLGIFFVNAALFGETFADMMQPHLPADEGFASQVVFWFTSIFCNGKFYPMFSLLFGAGLAIMLQTAQASGRRFGWTFFRRLVVLGIFGCLHVFLLWWGDVLLIYATIGLWMLWFGRFSVRRLTQIGFIVFGIGFLLWVALVTLMVLFDPKMPDDADVRPMPEGTRVEQIFAVFKDWQRELPEGETRPMYDPRLKAIERDITVNGPFQAVSTLRVLHYQMAIPFIIIIMFWVVLACFCWGAALLKSGFFHGKHREWRKRFIALGLFVGLPLNVIASIGSVTHDQPFWSFASMIGFNVGGPLMTLMYLSLILNWVDSGRGVRVSQALANVGRMALSAYLLESLLMCAVMQFWGLALFGSTTWAGRLGWVLGIYVVILFFCNFWLRVFRMGPMEWLWRTLTYLRFQKLVR